MPKPWVFLMLLFVFAIYPYALIFLRNYGPYVTGQLALSLKLQTHPPSSLSLTNLDELSSLPLIGQAFLQSKLKLLLMGRQWERLLSQTKMERLLMTVETTQKMLMYRTIAQCASLHFSECEDGLSQLETKAPHLSPKLNALRRLPYSTAQLL